MGHGVLGKARLHDIHENSRRKRQCIRHLALEQHSVGLETAAEFPPEVEEGEKHPDKRDCDGALQEPLQLPKQDDGQNKGSRPRQIREGIARRRAEVSTARDQNNFERRRKHHEEEIQADPGQVPRQLAVAQPERELRRRQYENAKTSEAGRSQEQLGIRNVPPSSLGAANTRTPKPARPAAPRNSWEFATYRPAS